MKYIRMGLEVISESKKARALVVALVMLAAVPLFKLVDVEVNQDLVDRALVVIIGYIVGQGVADSGLGKAPPAKSRGKK